MLAVHASLPTDGLGVEYSSTAIEKITNHTVVPAGHSRDVVRLLSGLLRSEHPRGETPKQAGTFIFQFMEAKDGFPKSEF